MKKLVILSMAGALALALLSENAVAQSSFYVFGAFGNTDSDVALGGLNRVDDDNSSYALGAGYAFTRNVSLEGAYQDFGSHNGETDCPPDFACVALVVPLLTKADLTAYSLSVIGSIPLTDTLDVFAQVGIASWDVNYKGISSVFDTSGEDLLYGAGLRWTIVDNWKFLVEYKKVDLGFDTAGIGVSYHF